MILERILRVSALNIHDQHPSMWHFIVDWAILEGRFVLVQFMANMIQLRLLIRLTDGEAIWIEVGLL